MARLPIDATIAFIYTRDLAASARFWGGAMGLSEVMDQGVCRLYRLTESSYVGLCDLPERPQSPVGLTLTIVTDDVDGWYARLKNAGVAVAEPPHVSERFQIYRMLLHDANCYRVEIQQFRRPDWPPAEAADGT